MLASCPFFDVTGAALLAGMGVFVLACLFAWTLPILEAVRDWRRRRAETRRPPGEQPAAGAAGPPRGPAQPPKQRRRCRRRAPGQGLEPYVASPRYGSYAWPNASSRDTSL